MKFFERVPARWKRGLCAVALLLAATSVVSTQQDPARIGPAQTASAQPPQPADGIGLPNREGSLKFAVLGDFGTGDRVQYELADQMAKLHSRFKFEMVILVGDNLYGGQKPADFQKKFEIPYKALLDDGVKFYASLGNHDARNQRFYKLFNMDGKLYYSFKAPKQNVRFFALESSYPDAEQMTWVEKALKDSTDDWKIPFFHHPLYSSGQAHGSDTRLRTTLEPMFVGNDVSVVFSGHDHFYERTKPQKDITYFVVGSGGKLRDGNINQRSGLTAKGFDTDLTFLAAEIFENTLTFNAVARDGHVVDSGVITRRQQQK